MSEEYIELKKENLIFEGKTEKEKKINETIYDLCLENDALYEENKDLKHILTEFEKWLEERINYWNQQEEIWIKEGFMKFGGEANNKIIFKGCLDKLQELKEGKK